MGMPDFRAAARQLVQRRHQARAVISLVITTAGQSLPRGFGALSSVVYRGSIALIPLFIVLGAMGGTATGWAAAIGFAYTLAISALVLGLAIAYARKSEWRYLWPSARPGAGTPVPDTTTGHRRPGFAAERAFWTACILCAGMGLIGLAAGIGVAALPAAVAGSAAFLVAFTAAMGDMTGSVPMRFWRR